MIKKIKSSLSAKVFMITAALMAACCSVTYFCIIQFAPYIYTHDFSAINEELPFLAEEFSRYTKEEAIFAMEDYSDWIVAESDGEFVFQLFKSDSEELKRFDRNDTSKWCRLTFAGSGEEYTVFFSKNTEKESQVALALQKAVSVLSFRTILTAQPFNPTACRLSRVCCLLKSNLSLYRVNNHSAKCGQQNHGNR